MDVTWNEGERRCLMTQLLRMAMADGVVSTEERQLLSYQRQRLGFTEEDIESLQEAIDAGYRPDPPADPEACEQMFLEIIELAASDQVADSERAMLFAIAPEFGMSEDEVRSLLDEFDSF